MSSNRTPSSSVGWLASSPEIQVLAMVAVGVACLMTLAAVALLGLEFVVGCFVLLFILLAAVSIPLSIVLAWGWVYWRAPKLVTNATALLVVGACLASLLPGWLLESRYQARQLQTSNNLRRLGLEMHQQMALHPNRRPPQDLDEWSAYMRQVSADMGEDPLGP